MNRLQWYIILSLPLQILGLQGLKKYPIEIEQYYSTLLYPCLFDLHRFFFKLLPFSLGDLFYFLILALIIAQLASFIRKPKGDFKKGVVRFIALISLVHFLFYLNWGLHYYRVPLAQKLNYEKKYTEQQLIITLEHLIETANILHAQLVNEDTLGVQIPYDKKTLMRLLNDTFVPLGTPSGIQPYSNNSIWSIPLSYMGYAGYLNPFTLEAQVNSKIPKLSYITTVVHEMAHQTGIAAENEANFIAFYNAIKHSDPFIQYAGYTFALRYCYGELFKSRPEKAKEILSSVRPGIINNFREQSAFWKMYENPFEPYFKKGYDRYLKANGQIEGIQSYNAMVALVIAYLEEALETN